MLEMAKHRRPPDSWAELREEEPTTHDWRVLVSLLILIGVLLVPALVLRFH